MPEEAVSGVLAELKSFVELIRHGQYLVEQGLFDAGAPEAVRSLCLVREVVESKMSGVAFGEVFFRALQAVSEGGGVGSQLPTEVQAEAVRFFEGVRELSAESLLRDRVFEHVEVLC